VLPEGASARPGIKHSTEKAAQVRGREQDGFPRMCDALAFGLLFSVAKSSGAHDDAVVGSIIFFTSVIFVAGKPLISACLWMMASSLAR
jgi:hypothetical protein